MKTKTLKQRIKEEMMVTPLRECQIAVEKTLKETNGPDFDAGLILLASAQVGPNIKRVAKFTGYSRKVVAEIGRKARDNGIWRGGKLDVEWCDEETGGVAFVCDVATVRGFMARSR